LRDDEEEKSEAGKRLLKEMNKVSRKGPSYVSQLLDLNLVLDSDFIEELLKDQ